MIAARGIHLSVKFKDPQFYAKKEALEKRKKLLLSRLAALYRPLKKCEGLEKSQRDILVGALSGHLSEMGWEKRVKKKRGWGKEEV